MNYHKYVKNDYKNIAAGGEQTGRQRLATLLAVGTIALGLSAFGYLGDAGHSPRADTREPAGPASPARTTSTAAAPDAKPETAVLALAGPAAATAPDPAGNATAIAPSPSPHADLQHHEITVRPGDSLAAIFRRHGIAAADLAVLVRDKATDRRLSRLQPGQQITLMVDGDDRLQRLVWMPTADRALVATRDETGFAVEAMDAAALAATTGATSPATPEVAPAPVAPLAAEGEPAGGLPLRRLEAEVGRGDSLAAIFKRLDIPPAELALLVRESDARNQLSRIKPGQGITLVVDASRRLQRLEWRKDRIRTLIAERAADDVFQLGVDEVELTTERVAVSGTITSSLFEAGIEAGMSDRTIMEMAEILGWDIDFAQDLREGDRFSVLYEEHYGPDGEKVKDGDILAVAFTNRGRDVQALRYTKPDGEADYYSPDGRSMRKAFRRMPVRFGRVSSRFTQARWHPVLHRFRAHKGVDYAAPRGTPILATGDGKVVFRGRKGGYGKTIVIKHGERYTTLYAHMKGYHRGTTTGSRVKQGQVVGYVGSTGLATGPHVHYEFRVNGIHRDPLKVELPKALPLEEKYLADFRAKSAPLVARLEQLRRTRLALNDD